MTRPRLAGAAALVAPLAALLFALPAAAQTGGAQTGGPMIVEGNGQQRALDCTDRDVVVRGDRNALTFTGGCRSLEVLGSTNEVRAEMAPASRIAIRGDTVSLYWSLRGDGPPPRIATEGRQVAVQQVQATGRADLAAGRGAGQVTRRETARGLALSLSGDVLFPFGSDRLRPEAAEGLQEVATLIRDLRPQAIRIVGHTDSVGDDATNRELSLRRARSVQRWLEERAGGAMPPVIVEGRGEGEPVAPNATPDGRDNPEGRALNRRVEFVLDR